MSSRVSESAWHPDVSNQRQSRRPRAPSPAIGGWSLGVRGGGSVCGFFDALFQIDRPGLRGT